MRKKKIIGLIVAVCMLLAILGLAGCSAQSFESDAKGIESLLEAMDKAALSSENYYSMTHKVKSEEENSKGVKADDGISAFYQNNGKGDTYMSTTVTVNKLTSDKFLATSVTEEYWNSLMYETVADKDTKDTSKKKNLTVYKESTSTDKLDGSKKQTDYTSEASYTEGNSGKIIGLADMIKPYIELIKTSDAYQIKQIKREGKIDYFYIQINEQISKEYNALGVIEFTVLHTETYSRISSISNVNDVNDTKISDKESLVINFSYARPSMNTVKCAEEYVNSINNPQAADKTMMYVYIGLGVGLGVPIVALLLWFIIKKARFFKDFDPDEMDMDDYIAMKKGLPLPSQAAGNDETAESAETENTATATDESDSETNGNTKDGGNVND